MYALIGKMPEEFAKILTHYVHFYEIVPFIFHRYITCSIQKMLANI